MLEIIVPTIIITFIISLVLAPTLIDDILYWVIEREKKRKNKDE